MTRPASGSRFRQQRCAVAWAVLAVVAVTSWQALIVVRLRGSDWSAPFHSGESFPPPPALARHTYVFPGAGYDGQFYRYVAHDPWLERGFSAFIDDPRHRYGRILVPALAHAVGSGSPRGVDAAFIALVFLSCGLGVCWTSLWLQSRGCAAGWGCVFLILPATLASVDRMLVDATLCMEFAAYLVLRERSSTVAVWLVCALAALTRETGLFLVAAATWEALRDRRWRRAVAHAAAAIPAAAWLLFVAHRTGPSSAPAIFARPVVGLVERLLVQRELPGEPPWIAAAVHTLDVLSVLGLILSIAIAAAWLRSERAPGVTAAVGLFCALGLAAGHPSHLIEAFGFGRPVSPLLLWVTLVAIARRAWWALPAPLAVTPALASNLLRSLGIVWYP